MTTVSRSVDYRCSLMQTMQGKELFSCDSPEVKGPSGLKPHTNLPFLLEGHESKKRLQGEASSTDYGKALEKLQSLSN